VRPALLSFLFLTLPFVACSEQPRNDDEVVDTTLNESTPLPTAGEMTTNQAVQRSSTQRDVGAAVQSRAASEQVPDATYIDDEESAEVDRVEATGAVAHGDLRAVFSGDDYPASALAAGAQGTARATLTIGPDGRVIACVITQSTGNAALDAATCNVIRRRAVFTPARDRHGNATTDTVTTPPIRWQLEG
jgi:TonB family protein